MVSKYKIERILNLQLAIQNQLSSLVSEALTDKDEDEEEEWLKEPKRLRCTAP